MNDDPTQAAQCSGKPYRPGVARRGWNWLKRWMFLNIWCSHLYRPFSRLIHRFNMHYCSPVGMSPKYGKRDVWCHWCGLRGSVYTPDPKGPIEFISNRPEDAT